MRAWAVTLSLFILLTFLSSGAGRSASTERLESFLKITGFDVALESIKLSADAAPEMLGLEAKAFGARWQDMVDQVFDPRQMHETAVGMLAETLDPVLLDHAIQFYNSELGQRLVKAENASHLEPDEDLKRESGEAIVAGLVRLGAPRLEGLKRLMSASGSTDASIHAIQEIQVRFLLGAAAAGVIDLQMDEADLRASLVQQEAELRRHLQTSGMTNAAYTYQAFSDAELEAYAAALEDPRMQDVYALMNAVQFQIMADLFEILAMRMQGLQPSQEL